MKVSRPTASLSAAAIGVTMLAAALATPAPARAQAGSATTPPPLAPAPLPPPTTTTSTIAIPSPTTPDAYADAQALIADKRYPAAVEKLRQVTAARPDFAPGWFALALAARRAGQCADAIPAYRRYAALQPSEAEPYYGLGLCLRDTGDRAGAVTALRRFVELERRPEQQKWVAIARKTIADLEPPAAPVAAPPTRADTGRGNGAYEEAQRLRDAGRVDAALKKFADAVTLDPDLIAARAAWGELLIKLHREGEAVGVLRAAVEHNAQYALAWYELGFALRETGQLADAVEAYRRYIALRPTDPDPHYGLARALQKLGRDEEAARSFAAYVALEKRPEEERWVASAKAELATRSPHAATAPARPALMAAPAAAPSATAPDRATAPPR